MGMVPLERTQKFQAPIKLAQPFTDPPPQKSNGNNFMDTRFFSDKNNLKSEKSLITLEFWSEPNFWGGDVTKHFSVKEGVFSEKREAIQ